MKDESDRSRYQFEILETDSIGQVMALLEQCFDRWGTTPEVSEPFWRWKHEENPFGRSLLLVARDADKSLVSLRAVMRWKLQVGPGEPLITAARMVDTATHPEHRGRGLFSQLTKWAVDDLREREVPLLFNTPNQNSLPGYRKLGWSRVDKLRIYGRPPTIRGIIGKKDESESPFLLWRAFVDQYGDRVAEVARRHEEARAVSGYRTPRSLEYLSWRYGSIPGGAYGVYVEEDDGNLTGFVIGRRIRGFGGLRAFSISEMFHCLGLVDQLKEMLLEVATRTEAHYLIAHFSKDSTEYEALRRSVFCPLPGRAVTLAARTLGPSPLDPISPECWDLSLGDIEVL